MRFFVRRREFSNCTIVQFLKTLSRASQAPVAGENVKTVPQCSFYGQVMPLVLLQRKNDDDNGAYFRNTVSTNMAMTMNMEKNKNGDMYYAF